MAANNPSRDPTLRHLTDEQVERIDRETTSVPCRVAGCPCRESIIPLSLCDHPQPQQSNPVTEPKSSPDEDSTEDANASEEPDSRPLRERVDFQDVHRLLLEELAKPVSTDLIQAWLNARTKALSEGQLDKSLAHFAPIMCANPECTKRGSLVCAGCSLVAYCCKDCQTKHWKRAENPHKIHCRSGLAKKEWRPTWEIEDRSPTFKPISSLDIADDYIHPWGNFPAHDILRLAQNEGIDHNGELSVLFAEAQDFRNAMKIIFQLPPTFKGSLKITLNDFNIHLAIRQVFTLLLLQIDDPAIAADVIIHLWYSAFLRKDHIALIERYVRPVLGIIDAPADADPAAIVPFNFKLGQGTVSVQLKAREWQQLATLFIRDLGDFTPSEPQRRPGPAHLHDHDQRSWHVEVKARLHLALGVRKDPYQDQFTSRQKFMMRDVDSHDRTLIGIRGEGHLHQRLSRKSFLQDGILLPYGTDRSHYTEFNPTLWYLGYHWRVSDTADPLHAWSPRGVREAFYAWTSVSELSNDLYGQLSVFLRGAIAETSVRLRNLPISFEVRTDPPADLPAALEGARFDRIDIGNPGGPSRNGLPAALAAFAPLLSATNPHATLIALVAGLAADASLHDPLDTTAMFRGAAAFLQVPFFGVRPASADAQLYDRARSLFAPVPAWLERHVAACRADGAAAAAGLARRGANRCVELCPFAMRGKPGDAGAQQEFDDRLAMRDAVDGSECFVEWARAGPAGAEEEEATTLAAGVAGLRVVADGEKTTA